MYRLFTGKNTFDADNPFDARIAVLNFPITPIETYRKDFPPALTAVIERAIDEHLQPLERQVAAAGDGAKRLRGRARAVARPW